MTRMSGKAETKASARVEEVDQDKAGVVSQDTPAEGAQSSAALAAPVGAAQQTPELKDGESVRLRSQHLELTRSGQAGAPVLRTEETYDSLAQAGNARAPGLLGSSAEEIYDKWVKPGLEGRRKIAGINVTRQMLEEELEKKLVAGRRREKEKQRK